MNAFLQKRNLIWPYLFLAVLAACGTPNHRSQRSDIPRATVVFPSDGVLASVKSDLNGVMVASLDPLANSTQIVEASGSSRIKGYSVAFPPGALAIATDISMKEGESYSSDELVSTAGLSEGTKVTGSSAPVSITASTPIDLAVPMVVALAVPSTAGLTDQPLPIERMGVVFRTLVQSTGERLAGVTPVSSLTVQDGRILYPTKYFGWFQVTVFDKPVTATQQQDTRSMFQAITMVFIGQPLPSCGLADLGRTIYSQEQSTFLYCSSSGWTSINLQGPQGAAGPVGPTGPAGPQGTAGAPGKPGNSPQSTAFSLYDATRQRLGTIVGIIWVYVPTAALIAVGSKTDSTQGYFEVRIASGGFGGGLCASTPASSNSGNTCTCLYADSTCSSPTNKCRVPGKPLPLGIFRLANGAWVRASGTEPKVSESMLDYYHDGFSCKTYVMPTSSYYEVSAAYTYPSDVAGIPATQLPLYVDP